MIKIAKNSGFCFGVKRAIEITEKEIENREKGDIYTCGPLIHNRIVTDDLEKRGVGIIDNPEEAKAGDTVIVRSHGEPADFFRRAEAHEIRVVDATCPFVKRIHKLVAEAYANNEKVIIIGTADHPEVMGINGWCDCTALIVNSPEEAEKVPEGKYLLVCQTTIKKELMDQVVEVLKKRDIQLRVENTICNATSERQESCRNLAKVMDAMVVIGGRHSSNTAKLFEISKEFCNNSYFVEKFSDLPLQEVTKYNKIGIAAGASTPESVIKEVLTNMSENITNEMPSMEDFMDEIDASLRLPRTGEIVDGKVHQVTDDVVIVNLGCKKDGILPTEEVTFKEGETLTDLFKVGDEVQAKVIKTDDGDGGILLSKKKLEINKHWKEINDAYEDKSTIEVTVIRVVKGGVIAKFKEVSGFIPMSQLSDRYVETADPYLGETLAVKVTRVDQRRNRVVFSHKAVLSEEKKAQVEKLWENVEVGDIVEGTVMRFTDYGAFVDIGGIDGLLHISEISWGKLRHPKEALEIGQDIKIKILSMNQEKGKISLGLKQTIPEPWSVIDENYKVGEVIEGKVVQLKEYGAFVELEPGLDGLVHISEVAHRRVNDISEELKVGQTVETKILDIDTDRRRISLSIKATVEPEEGEIEAEETDEIAE